MFPFEVVPLDKSVNDRLMNHFSGEKSGFVQVGPQKYVFPAKYDQYKESYYGLEPRADDVWVVTFPRSGTTLTQEIIWLLNNNLDFETASRVPIDARFPFLEFNCFLNDKFVDEIFELNGRTDGAKAKIEMLCQNQSEVLKSAASPRLIKTHLPFSLIHPNLVETSRVVYVARNPKDVAVSFFHLNVLCNVHGFTGDFETFWTDFEDDLDLATVVLISKKRLDPELVAHHISATSWIYVESLSVSWAPYWSHIKEGWERRNHKNVLFLFYEDFIKDLKGSIEKISKFLEKPVTSKDLDKLYDFLQIDNFRKNMSPSTEDFLKGMINPNGQSFIRRGKIGGNPEYSDALGKRADAWIQKHMSQLDIQFPSSN